MGSHPPSEDPIEERRDEKGRGLRVCVCGCSFFCLGVAFPFSVFFCACLSDLMMAELWDAYQ